ncbi:MAG: DMT family transporter [Gemmatimonadaceae bacterium]
MARRDLVDLILLGAIWGAAFLFTRIAVPEFGPVALVEVRVIIAALVVVGLVAARRRLGEFRGRWRALTLIAVLNTAVPFALYAYATRTVPAGFAAVLNATVPLFGALVGRAFFGERLGREQALGLAVGFLGVLVLVAPRLEVAGTPLAIAAALVASLMYGIAAHLTRRVLPGVHSVVIAAGSLVASAVLLAIPAALLWPRTMPSAGAWMSTIALAVLATGIAYVLYFRLLERVGATGAVAVTYLIPLFGMVWGGLFLGERVTLAMGAGCTLILLGVAVTTGALRLLIPRERPAP